MEYFIHIIFSVTISYIFFKNYFSIASKIGLIDNKNPHYNNQPTPTGSGIIFSLIICAGSFLFYFTNNNFKILLPNNYIVFIITIFVLSVISFKDDIKTIDPILRLIIQIILIFMSLTLLPLHLVPLPTKVSFIFFTFFWIYIVNISNFIDGSDGFLSVNFIFIVINVLILKFTTNVEIFSFYISLIILPCIIIFLYFNKPPAKIYMGDAGSITLGYIVGFIVIDIFFAQRYGVAISILAYMFCDCTFSLIKKMKKGYMPWIGLYDYYYLIPVLKNKKNHKKVLKIILIFQILNSMIILLQIFTGHNLYCLASIMLATITMQIYKKIN